LGITAFSPTYAIVPNLTGFCAPPHTGFISSAADCMSTIWSPFPKAFRKHGKPGFRNMDYDVIVVGAGNAAFAAVVSARERGAKRVVVLEKVSSPHRRPRRRAVVIG